MNYIETGEPQGPSEERRQLKPVPSLRDRPRGGLQAGEDTRCDAGRARHYEQTLWRASAGKTPLFWRRFILTMIVLPRQARDKQARGKGVFCR